MSKIRLLKTNAQCFEVLRLPKGGGEGGSLQTCSQGFSLANWKRKRPENKVV